MTHAVAFVLSLTGRLLTIVGAQETPDIGSYLVTEEIFSDFEVEIEARPDWPADTGVLVRTNEQGNIGFLCAFHYSVRSALAGSMRTACQMAGAAASAPTTVVKAMTPAIAAGSQGCTLYKTARRPEAATK